MSERCQTKFAEKFDNKNYIIYFGILCTLFAVLYFYRFHFATITLSYVLGCLACYCGLNSNILYEYIHKLKCHLICETSKEEVATVQGCVTCGSKECVRHDASVAGDPWVGLQIHKQLDQAIEEFYNTILDQFINSWYSRVTLQPFFVDELRHQLRYASACLLQRAVKINYSRLITERLVPCALRHYTVCAERTRAGALLDCKLCTHPAAANRHAELNYLRCITKAIMPYLLKNNELDNSVFRVLVREIFAGWVLLALTDVLADPYILNTLIVLATGDSRMAQLPTTPDYKVEFLETFARQTESIYAQRCKLLKVDLELVLNEQEHFYSFMQYMKSTSDIHLLQFYNDIKSFQTKILNPDLGEQEQAALHKEASDMYWLYLSQRASTRHAHAHAHALHDTLAQELRTMLDNGESVKKLQTSRALYQAARQSHAVLEKTILPKFLHSEEFYKLLIGSRIPTGFNKHMAKKPQERLINTALRIGNRLKGALKPQTMDGQILDTFNDDESEGDGADNLDIRKYLDNLAAEQAVSGHDLSTYKVVLTHVETKLQGLPRRGTVRVFTLAVHRVEAGAAAALWTVERSEHDFHLLRSKLHEFHGDRLLHDLPLPSRRDNSPLETLRYKYEDFLQRLLQKSLLQTSELLRIFLTEDGDFSLVVQASTMNANSTDLTNIYQSVAHRLRKEKGQHLESFLRNLLVSSDIDRYQAIKQGTHVEEALEMSEEISVEMAVSRPRRPRDIRSGVFGNNFDIRTGAADCATCTCPATGAGPGPGSQARLQDTVRGFTHCLMYLLIKVLKVRSFITNIVGTMLGLTRDLADEAFNRYLNTTLTDLLSERRLAHLIRLGHGLLFVKRAATPRSPASLQRDRARAQLARCVPHNVALAAGPGLAAALHTAFDIIQVPQLNKQLVYNLLDLCVVELFPELGATDASSLPKS